MSTQLALFHDPQVAPAAVEHRKRSKQPKRPTPPPNPSSARERLLATPASVTVLENVPESMGGDEAEAWLHGYLIQCDGSGPKGSLSGATVDCWGAVQRALRAAWDAYPRETWPPFVGAPVPHLTQKELGRIRGLHRDYAKWPKAAA